MNSMSTGQAVQNLDNLIAGSRMTRQEHVGMQQSLELLKQKAAKLDGQAKDVDVSIKDAVNIGAEAGRSTTKWAAENAKRDAAKGPIDLGDDAAVSAESIEEAKKEVIEDGDTA